MFNKIFYYNKHFVRSWKLINKQLTAPLLKPQVYLLTDKPRHLLLCSFNRNIEDNQSKMKSADKFEKQNNELNQDMEAKALEIFEKLESKKFKFKISLKSIEEKLKILYEQGVSLSKIGPQFVETPDIILYHSHHFLEKFEFFRSAGFESDVIWKNVVLCPEILNLPLNKLHTRFLMYLEFEIGSITSLIKLINR